MNDSPEHRADLYSLHGLPDRPNRCRCGAEDAFVDGHNLQGRPGPFFVWCARCDRSGPERPSYALAIAAWNRDAALSPQIGQEVAP